LPTVRLRTKFFAYSSIAYKLYFAQLKISKTKLVRLHTRHCCTQVALHTWYYCLQIDCLRAILRTIQKLRQASKFAHTNQLPTVSFADIPFVDGSFTHKNFCLQFDCLQALFRTIKKFPKRRYVCTHDTIAHKSHCTHDIIAYRSIAYMLFCAQLNNSETKVRLHTRHYCAQVALRTWCYCL